MDVSQNNAAMDAMEDREWIREFHGYVHRLYFVCPSFLRLIICFDDTALMTYTQGNVPDQLVRYTG